MISLRTFVISHSLIRENQPVVCLLAAVSFDGKWPLGVFQRELRLGFFNFNEVRNDDNDKNDSCILYALLALAARVRHKDRYR